MNRHNSGEGRRGHEIVFHECHIIGQWWFVGIVSFGALIQYRSMYKPVRSSADLQGG